MLVCATDKDSLSSETHETDRSSCSQPFDLLCQVLRAEWHRADSARSILPVFQLSAQRRAPQLFSGRAVDETAVAPRANLCRCLHPIHGYGTRIDGNRAPHVYLWLRKPLLCALSDLAVRVTPVVIHVAKSRDKCHEMCPRSKTWNRIDLVAENPFGQHHSDRIIWQP